ncbi:MFS transporter [Rhizobium puerariae]|uniref:MFS transporter n=1 Tax=Rhizobium puerariae TaxID=1585791 RepID=A0ABV6AI11_9HYPH
MAKRPFDLPGFLLSGFGVGAVIFGLDSFARENSVGMVAPALAGIISLWLYVHHARRRPDAILDIRLFRHPAFRASMFGGTLFRVGFGAMPFMLPLLMQVIFGYTALQSGAITFVAAIGAFGMRTLTRYILNRFGFRSVLSWNALISSLFMGLCAAFNEQTAVHLMMAVIFLGGVFRALQFTSLNALSFAEVTDAEMSHATTLSQMALRISQGVGVALAAILLHFYSGNAGNLTSSAFSASFVVIALISAFSSLSFFALSRTAGDALIGRSKLH